MTRLLQSGVERKKEKGRAIESLTTRRRWSLFSSPLALKIREKNESRLLRKTLLCRLFSRRNNHEVFLPDAGYEVEEIDCLIYATTATTATTTPMHMCMLRAEEGRKYRT